VRYVHFLWALTFFGLPSDYTVYLHSIIFDICYHGNGGFTFSEVYNMPVHLRMFYYNKLVQAKQHEKSEIENSRGSKGGISRPNVSRPPGKVKMG